jgi:hypothetical protein
VLAADPQESCRSRLVLADAFKSLDKQPPFLLAERKRGSLARQESTAHSRSR